jgi:hypothetical protein
MPLSLNYARHLLAQLRKEAAASRHIGASGRGEDSIHSMRQPAMVWVKPDAMKLPRISVIIVSDYGGADGHWLDEREMLSALATQDIREPFEIVLAADSRTEGGFPEEFLNVVPHTRAVFLPSSRSSALKDQALDFAHGEMIAVLEADSIPSANWLRLLVEALDGNPEAAAVSGRTIYGRETALKRAVGLIDRAFIDVGKLGATQHVGNNGALYRRPVLESHSYPDEENPFVSGRMRNAHLMNSGCKMLFHPDAVMVHRFEGLRFAFDVRRNVAFSDGRAFFLSGDAKGNRLGAGLTLAWRRLVSDWRSCRRVHRAYIRWYDWPLVVAMLIGFKFVEWPSIGRGLSGWPNLERTGYR